ncbi:MAG TPA: nitroreductase family protein [Nitrospirales bacterium]|nr:nitroreductase family protein [Nitrospirales bacterium]
MEKPAETQYPIHDLLKRRWSPRAFSDRLVEPATMRSLLEAARWAPSSSNEQPWSFIVATKQDPAEYARLLSCLVEGNIQWAQHAPVLMVSVAKLSFEENGKPNRHAFYDVGQAVANLIVQATALGLVVHQMAGFHPDKVRELFGVPEQYEPVAAIALGYPGDPQSLPERLRNRELAPRERKPLTEFVFSGRWGQTSPIVTG